MTLVIGIPCFDGFVIAADSQETAGVRNHVQKICMIQGDVQLFIGMCGETVAARACADLLIEVILEKKGPTGLEARKLIRRTLKTFYQGLPEFTSPNGTKFSDVELLIGYRDRNGIANLYRASQNGFTLAHDFVAIGMARGIADILAARLFNRFGTSRMATATARHWAKQVMREGRADPSVGGNSDIVSVRNDPPNGPDFFEIPDPQVLDGYLWGAQQQLFWAIENALNGHQTAVDGHLGTMAATLKAIASAHAQSERSPDTVKMDTDSPPAGYGRF